MTLPFIIFIMQPESTTPRSLPSISRFASLFFGGTLLSRLFGLGRDLCLAYFFGTSAGIAAFFVAFRFAHLARRLFGEGSMQAAFIPIYEKLKQTSEEQATGFFYKTQKQLALFLSFLVAASMAALFFFRFSLPLPFQSVALYTFYLLPSLIFICLFGLSAGILHSEKRFFLSSVSSVSFNLTLIACLPLLSLFSEEKALLGLCFAVTLASLSQYLTSYLPTRFTTPPQPFVSVDKEHTKTLLKTLAYGVIGIGATQINSFLDPFFAKIASPEGPAYLWFSARVSQLPIGLIAVSFSSALLPTLSSLIKQEEEQRAKKVLLQAVKNALSLSIFFLGAMVFLGSQGIRLLYGHGHFDDISVLETSKCLIGYSLGLLPTTFVILIAPYFYAHGAHRLTSIASFLSVCTNFLLNAFFVLFLQWGSLSIAIATSISAWVNGAALLYFWKKKWGDFPYKDLQKGCFSAAALTVSAAVFSVILRFFFGVALKEQLLLYPKAPLLEAIGQFAGMCALFFLPLGYLCLYQKKEN